MRVGVRGSTWPFECQTFITDLFIQASSKLLFQADI